MAKTFFDLIGNLAQEVKNDGRIWKIIAKRCVEDYDETVDYSKYKFYCMFHKDKHNKNFQVKKNYFKCYACGEEGSTIDFLMKFENLSFQDAVIQAAFELDIIDEATYNKLKKGKSFGVSYQKREYTKEEKNEIANIDDLHYVYSLFAKGNTLINKPKLTKPHLMHLMKERNLSLDEIDKIGYFSFPSIYILKHIIKQMKKDGKDLEMLFHIPGFFYDNKKEKITFMLLKGNSGICIPIRNLKGKIIGIQIRLDTVEQGEQRYIWFSSNFASGGDYSKGTSPGVPIDVCVPNGYSIETVPCQTIFITEGHFKAIKLAKDFKTIVLSVQGVHNWREIPFILDSLKNINPKFKHIYIMYDADMAYKETVLQPAIKLGLSLTNLNFKGYKNDVEEILSINKKFKTPLIELEDSKLRVKLYLEQNLDRFKFDITYCLWDSDIGKGIDDYLEKFNTIDDAIKGIKKIQLIDFWECSYMYLRLNELCKFDISCKYGIDDIHEIALSEDVKKYNFLDSFFKNNLRH